jgi:hypothetical protein
VTNQGLLTHTFAGAALSLAMLDHELATDGEGRRRVQSREGLQVVRWLLAVRERTGRPFGVTAGNGPQERT